MFEYLPVNCDNYRLTTGHLPVTYQSPAGQLPAVYRLTTGHLPDIYRSSTEKIATIYQGCRLALLWSDFEVTLPDN